MIVGFSGTRDGMTEAQKAKLEELLTELNPDQFRHGDCLGADEEAHFIARELGVPVVTHPPIEDKLRAYTMGAIIEIKAAPYHVRNKAIVDNSHVLVAAPKEATEDPAGRGGTWQTINMARRSEIPVYIIWPSGAHTVESVRDEGKDDPYSEFERLA